MSPNQPDNSTITIGITLVQATGKNLVGSVLKNQLDYSTNTMVITLMLREDTTKKWIERVGISCPCGFTVIYNSVRKE